MDMMKKAGGGLGGRTRRLPPWRSAGVEKNQKIACRCHAYLKRVFIDV